MSTPIKSGSSIPNKLFKKGNISQKKTNDSKPKCNCDFGIYVSQIYTFIFHYFTISLNLKAIINERIAKKRFVVNYTYKLVNLKMFLSPLYRDNIDIFRFRLS